MSENAVLIAGRMLQFALFVIAAPFLIGVAVLTICLVGGYIYLLGRIGFETLAAIWRFIS